MNNNPLAPNTSYVEWGAVIAGAVLASAISIILVQFGHALGLSADTYITNEKAKGMILTIGVYLFVTQLASSMSGGYISGRLRGRFEGATEHESEVRDGAHGLLAWALGTMIAAIAVAAATFVTAIAVDPSVAPAQHTSAELMKSAGIVFGFANAAGAIVSAVAAWYMATVGGDHRDRSVDVSHHISFRKRK